MPIKYDHFQNLKYPYLKVFAHRFAVENLENDFVAKITLHLAPFHSYRDDYKRIKYIMCFHIPDLDGKDEDLCLRIRVFKDYFEAPDMPCEVSGLPIELWGDDSFFVDVYHDHATGGRDEWEFRAISQIPREWIEEYWVLFDRSPLNFEGEKSAEEDKDSSENVVTPSKMLLQLEPDDRVKIQIPGEIEEIVSFKEFGFRSVRTSAAEAFIAFLDKGEYFSNSAAQVDHVKQAEKKLKKHFKSNEKFIVLSKRGSGRYVPVFKIRKQVQFEKLENELSSLRDSGEKDSVHIAIARELENGNITNEEAKDFYEKFQTDLAESSFDRSKELSVKGSFHVQTNHN